MISSQCRRLGRAVNPPILGVHELEDDTMLDWAAVKDLAALDEYSKENPHLNLG